MQTAEKEFHRKNAARSFNKAWDYLVKKGRSSEDNRRMLNLAHASRYHWGFVGTPRNRVVGDWQLSRVYADIGRGDLAVSYAKASLSACRKYGLEDITSTVYEGMARAYAASRDAKRATIYLGKARRSLDRATLDKEDRRVYLGQIRETQRLIDRLR
jgi:hypothetical protein